VRASGSICPLVCLLVGLSVGLSVGPCRAWFVIQLVIIKLTTEGPKITFFIPKILLLRSQCVRI
jgi:hypothetical protein